MFLQELELTVCLHIEPFSRKWLISRGQMGWWGSIVLSVYKQCLMLVNQKPHLSEQLQSTGQTLCMLSPCSVHAHPGSCHALLVNHCSHFYLNLFKSFPIHVPNPLQTKFELGQYLETPPLVISSNCWAKCHYILQANNLMGHVPNVIKLSLLLSSPGLPVGLTQPLQGRGTVHKTWVVTSSPAYVH